MTALPSNRQPATQSAAGDTTATKESLARLLIQCPDQPGIVSAVSGILAEFGANIVSLDQHSTDPTNGQFFQRTEFHLEHFNVQRPELETRIAAAIEVPFGAKWQLTNSAQKKRVAIFVSKTDHCLLDLLWRHRSGELDIDITMVISNHSLLAEDVRYFGIPFIHIPSDANDKSAMEKAQLELVRGNVDLIVLARYMQIISDQFLQDVGVPMINIHHSFLPAFIGAGPYQKAKDRGVKMIGATAHYVTADLDEGPIIEQDTIRVTHAETTRELMRQGADVERHVLTRAVAWHCDDRILRHGNHTVVF